MQDKIIPPEIMEEIKKIYVPPNVKPHPGFRVYYDRGTLDIICFSQEELDHPYIQTTEQIYMSGRVDLYKISEGRLVRKEEYFSNRLQLKSNGSKFASVKDDMQFAVPLDWDGDKSFWDPING